MKLDKKSLTDFARNERERFEATLQQFVEIPTVSGRNEVPKLAEFLAGELKAAGFAADDVKIMPYEGETGDKTVALIARWRADKPTAKPILLMAHMDVVEAKREELAALPAVSPLTADEVAEIRAIGDNTGSMALKGAAPDHEGEPRPDRWPLTPELEELAARWGIEPARDLVPA